MCAIQPDTRIKSAELKKLAHMISLYPIHEHINDHVKYISDLNKEYSGQDSGKIIDTVIGILNLRSTSL